MTDTQILVAAISFAGTSLLAFIALVGTSTRDNTKVLREISLAIQRHDFQFERLGERFDSVDRRFDAVDQRFDRIEATLAEHNDHFAELRVRGDRLADQIFSLGKRLDEHLRWHAS